MTNRVHVQHVLEFLRYNLQIAEEELTREQAVYNKAEVKYELKQQQSKLQKFLRKLGVKSTSFEKSDAGTLDWMCTQWDSYIWAKARVRKYKAHI